MKRPTCAATSIESFTLPALDELLALLEQRSAGRLFLAQMAQRLQDRHAQGDDKAPYQEWLAKVPARRGSVALRAAGRRIEAADNLSVSNAIVTSLRHHWRPRRLARTSSPAPARVIVRS